MRMTARWFGRAKNGRILKYWGDRPLPATQTYMPEQASRFLFATRFQFPFSSPLGCRGRATGAILLEPWPPPLPPAGSRHLTRENDMKRLVLSLATLSAFALAPAAAQSTQRLTTADYDRAVRLLGPSVTNLISRNAVNASWLADGRLWYR